MIIPFERLAPETLESLIESFVCREGTDYGNSEVSFKTKVEDLKAQILANEVLIVFDDKTASINLLTKQQVTWALQA